MSSSRFRIPRVHTEFAAVAGTVLALVVGLTTPTVAYAAVRHSGPSAQVSFTFDDGFLSSLTEAAPTLQKHGLTGTNYVPTDCVGMTDVPNTCRANPDVPHMTWDQIQELQNTYGWEIGSHTASHRCLASAGNGCQDNRLTPAEIDAELGDSKAALAAHGINATAFAPPYGDYDQTVMTTAAKYYSSMRGFADTGENYWPYSDYLLQNVPVQEGVTPVETLKAEVDEAIANNTWVVFTFHGITENPSQDPSAYEYGTAELDALAAYVQTKVAAGEIENVNVSDGLVTGAPNKMPNASFNSGIGEGWRTDAPANITADAGGNGSHPDPTRSVKLVSDASTSHLFSPQVAVAPGTDYLYKTFLDVASLTSGEVAFYIDEFDAAGDWVSGQYKTQENSRWVQELNFAYTPSSTDVARAGLQVIVKGTGITAYLDNVELLALGAETPPPPAPNLVTNGTFDAGIAGGWRTDAATAVVADDAGNGSPANPVNSVKLQGTSANVHLFSPMVDVTPGDYRISAHLDIRDRTIGDVGWYIDEYDADGNWISGQWKLASSEAGVMDVDLSYSPSSAEVATASLQVYVTGDTELLAYLDDVRWWRP